MEELTTLYGHNWVMIFYGVMHSGVDCVSGVTLSILSIYIHTRQAEKSG